MALEIVGALALGMLVLWLVFEPVIVPAGPALPIVEPEAVEETRRGAALLALKEIEFDKETGKLSNPDYEMLKSRYASEALAALETEAAAPAAAAATGDPEELISARLQLLRSARSTGSPARSVCPKCGPRPETDALFCSRCGLSLGAAGYCASCGSPLAPDSRFCAGCGARQ